MVVARLAGGMETTTARNGSRTGSRTGMKDEVGRGFSVNRIEMSSVDPHPAACKYSGSSIMSLVYSKKGPGGRPTVTQQRSNLPARSYRASAKRVPWFDRASLWPSGSCDEVDFFFLNLATQCMAIAPPGCQSYFQAFSGSLRSGGVALRASTPATL
jgi:hypothetical protein